MTLWVLVGGGGYLALGLVTVPIAMRILPEMDDSMVLTRGGANAIFWLWPFVITFCALVVLAIACEVCVLPFLRAVWNVPLRVARVTASEKVKVEGRDELPKKVMPHGASREGWKLAESRRELESYGYVCKRSDVG